MSKVIQNTLASFGIGRGTPEQQGYGTLPQTEQQPPPKVSASKIEPKVFLAAERTLIAWLRTTLLLGTFAVALYNSTASSSPTNIMGIVYAIISILAIFYAGAVYQSRCRKIAGKSPGHFDELWGPGIYSALIFAAVLVNFVIRVRDRDNVTHSPKSPWLRLWLSQVVNFAPSQLPS